MKRSPSIFFHWSHSGWRVSCCVRHYCDATCKTNRYFLSSTEFLRLWCLMRCLCTGGFFLIWFLNHWIVFLFISLQCCSSSAFLETGFNVFTLFYFLVVRSVVCGEHGWRWLVQELGEQQWERRLYITSSNHRHPRGRGVCSVTFDLSNVWGFCLFNGSKLTSAQSRGSRFTSTRVQLQRFSPSCQWQEKKIQILFSLWFFSPVVLKQS